MTIYEAKHIIELALQLSDGDDSGSVFATYDYEQYRDEIVDDIQNKIAGESLKKGGDNENS